MSEKTIYPVSAEFSFLGEVNEKWQNGFIYLRYGDEITRKN
ncbi:hypothetical protein [Oceanobacillus sp. 1P07AA]